MNDHTLTAMVDRQERIMHEGRLLKSGLVLREGETLYVERAKFRDWHDSLHNFYLISDRLCSGGNILEQKWNYDDFCDITVRMDDHTFVLNRQVDCIVLVRSYRPIPVDVFDRIARPLLYEDAAGTWTVRRVLASIRKFLTGRRG